MLFTSYAFLFLFLPGFLLSYVITPPRWRVINLLVGGYLFYAWWSVEFSLLLLAISVTGYLGGRWIEAGRSQARMALSVVVTLLLLTLAWFKYAGFLGRNWNALVNVLNIPSAALPLPEIVLPIGLSFFTFHTISYVVDVYRGKPACQSMARFAAYVALFPQLVAGPIVRYVEVAKELEAPVVDWQNLERGLLLFMLGFCKKVWIANNLGPGADWAFALDTPGFVAAWLGAASYTLQLYFDFSGYSDMALGLGLMLGFRFPQNFRTPYQASDITDFWRRWHITMSNFFRDYLYVPLGGNRHGALRTLGNLLVTMSLAGLWHGAGWTFVIWGLFHGALLVIHRAWSSTTVAGTLGRQPLWRGFSPLLTLLAVMVGWVFFRAASLDSALSVLAGMGGLQGAGPGRMLEGRFDAVFWAAMVIGWVYVVLESRLGNGFSSRRVAHGLLCLAFFGAIHELGSQAYNPFLYFQF